MASMWQSILTSKSSVFRKVAPHLKLNVLNVEVAQHLSLLCKKQSEASHSSIELNVQVRLGRRKSRFAERNGLVKGGLEEGVAPKAR